VAGQDGRSCQPQHGCSCKLASQIDRRALVARDVLVDQADAQRSLWRPNSERNDDLFGRVDAMDLEHVLGNIQIDRGNSYVDGSLM